MLKLVKIPVWTILLALLGLIGSLTAYAYSRDVRKIDDNAKDIAAIKEDYVSKSTLEKAFRSHYKLHTLEQENVEARHDDLKEYFSERFDDLKEYIKEN